MRNIFIHLLLLTVLWAVISPSNGRLTCAEESVETEWMETDGEKQQEAGADEESEDHLIAARLVLRPFGAEDILHRTAHRPRYAEDNGDSSYPPPRRR